MLIIEAAERRRLRRVNVFLSATIECAGKTADIRLRDLSEKGALIEGEFLPEPGTKLLFRRGELAVVGKVIRASHRRCAVVFDTELLPEEVLNQTKPVMLKPPLSPVQPSFKRPGVLVTRPLNQGDRAHAERLGVRL
jgi:hypothetical protein